MKRRQGVLTIPLEFKNHKNQSFCNSKSHYCKIELNSDVFTLKITI